MTDWVRRILEQYGQTVTLETETGRREARAFLQPVRERRETVPGTVTEIGWLDGRLWLYLGREEIRPGDTAEWNGMAFRVRSSRPYYIGGTLSHWRASLERRWEAAECGN